MGEVSSVWWSCPECHYQVCSKCEGYKRSVCPFSHFLELKKINVDIEQQEEQGEEGMSMEEMKRIKSKSKR